MYYASIGFSAGHRKNLHFEHSFFFASQARQRRYSAYLIFFSSWSTFLAFGLRFAIFVMCDVRVVRTNDVGGTPLCKYEKFPSRGGETVQ